MNVVLKEAIKHIINTKGFSTALKTLIDNFIDKHIKYRFIEPNYYLKMEESQYIDRYEPQAQCFSLTPNGL